MLRYRIVTFNIAHGRGLSPFQGLHGRRRFQRNLQKISKLLDELKPDIVALQEIDEKLALERQLRSPQLPECAC